MYSGYENLKSFEEPKGILYEAENLLGIDYFLEVVHHQWYYIFRRLLEALKRPYMYIRYQSFVYIQKTLTLSECLLFIKYL